MQKSFSLRALRQRQYRKTLVKLSVPPYIDEEYVLLAKEVKGK
jgi:hypothetical protein